MASYLVFPKRYWLRNTSERRVPLTFLPPIYGAKYESLCTVEGKLIRWVNFQFLRVREGAYIETDEPERVRATLAMTPNSEGICPCRSLRDE